MMMWNLHLSLLFYLSVYNSIPLTSSLPPDILNKALELGSSQQEDLDQAEKRTHKVPLLPGRSKNSLQDIDPEEKRANKAPLLPGRSKNSLQDIDLEEKRTNKAPLLPGRSKNSLQDIDLEEKRTNKAPLLPGRSKNSLQDIDQEEKRTHKAPLLPGRSKNSIQDVYPETKRTNQIPLLPGRSKNSFQDIDQEEKRTNKAPLLPGRSKNSLQDIDQEEKRTNKAPLLPGRSKNSLQANDSSICFPYFIAQDVDALLVQAARMLSKPINPRQRSWLQLFVHRLDSLSRQLRSLPVEHKNMCFQTRRKILSESNVDDDSLLNLSPEEVELRFAKEIFSVQDKPHFPQDHTKQYVMGTITNKRFKFGPYWLPVKKNSNFDPRAIASKYMASIPRPDSNTNMQSLDADREETQENLETLYKQERIDTMAENVPFLPRSTRKTIPWLKYHGQINIPKINEESLTGKSDDQPNNRNTGPAADSENRLRPDVMNEIHDTTTVNMDATTKPLHDPTKSSSNKYVEDDVMMQLHAGIASTAKVPQLIPSSTTIMPGPSSSAYDGSNIEPMGTQDKTEFTEAATNFQKFHNNEEQVIDDDDIDLKQWSQHAVPYELFDESGAYPRQHMENALDFDYEEQGAAVGELYADEDNSPLRQIAVPSSVEQLRIPNSVIKTADDDAVLQLRALKSPGTTDPPSSSTEVQDIQTIAQNTAPSNPKPHQNLAENQDSTNLINSADKIPVRIAGPAGRVHRRSPESSPKDISSPLVVDDKK